MNDTSAEVLISLIVPPALLDPLTDWLLECPELSGFVSQPVNGHGGSEHMMSAAEKVAGYRKGWLVQAHLPTARAPDLLDGLKRRFRGSDVHYWLTPVIEAGHLA